MKSKKEKKTETIKLRATKEEKAKLEHKAKAEGESISSLILRKVLYENSDSSHPFPQIIENNNFVNEIYHKVKKCNDETLKQDILSLVQKYFLIYRMEE